MAANALISLFSSLNFVVDVLLKLKRLVIDAAGTVVLLTKNIVNFSIVWPPFKILRITACNQCGQILQKSLILGVDEVTFAKDDSVAGLLVSLLALGLNSYLVFSGVSSLETKTISFIWLGMG